MCVVCVVFVVCVVCVVFVCVCVCVCVCVWCVWCVCGVCGVCHSLTFCVELLPGLKMTLFNNWNLWVNMEKGTFTFAEFVALDGYWPGLLVRRCSDHGNIVVVIVSDSIIVVILSFVTVVIFVSHWMYCALVLQCMCEHYAI